MSNQDRQLRIDALLKALCCGESGDVAVEQELIEESFFLACACGGLSVATAFLERDPAVATQAGGVNGWEPIQYACFSSKLRSDAERAKGIVAIVRRLLELGANPSVSYISAESEQWPQTLLYAASGIANHAELSGLLLAAGADVNEGLPEPDPKNPRKSPWGPEALYHSCEFRDIACLRLLLDARPRLLYVSYCLARALDFENPAAVRCFIEHGADPNFRVPWARNRTHLHRAVVNGRSAEIIGILLDGGGDSEAVDDEGMTAYRDAVRYGLAELQLVFEEHGACEATDEDWALGLLMQGKTSGSRPLRIDPELMGKAAQRNDVAALKSLLEAGAELEATRPGEMPPLHQAAWWGRADAVRFLIQQRADIHRTNPYGGDALQTAIHGSEHCFDAGFGPAAEPAQGPPPGDYPEIIELLLAAGAKLPLHVGGNAAVRRVLRQHGIID
jgi:ankyrin repeat protein